MRKLAIILFLPLFLLIQESCSVSYSTNGSSINYNLTKTIEIKDFQNQATLVYGPLAQRFNEQLRDQFNRNTKLEFTNTNPDLEIEGEITQYYIAPIGAKENNGLALAPQTRLTMVVRMRFRNNKNPAEDKEETISAYRDFDSNQTLTQVQDQLIEELSKEISDQIFNATMSNW